MLKKRTSQKVHLEGAEAQHQKHQNNQRHQRNQDLLEDQNQEKELLCQQPEKTSDQTKVSINQSDY